MTDDRKEPTLSPLKPEQDEIVRHRQRAASGGVKTPTGTSRAHTGSHRTVSTGSKLAPFAFLLAITGLGLAGYAYWQLLESQKTTEAALVRIADLESRLALTGDESEASMAALQAKLKWADSEIRKLWGVSYDTNRKNIAENKQAIAAARKAAGGIETKVNASLKELQADITVINDLVEAQQSTLNAVEDERLKMQQQARQVNDALKQAKETQAALQERVKSTEQAIEAIDAFRLSVNRDLLELKSQGSGP